MQGLHVGVIRGGLSEEYPVSLKTGGEILKRLPEGKYVTHDILIDRQGRWHQNGWEKKPEKILPQLDVVLIALHGYFGEDGKVQKILENHKVPYVGSGPMASAMGLNKVITKKMFERHGLKTPQSISIPMSENVPDAIHRAYRSFPQPSIIKPYNGGSSIGVAIAKNFSEFKDAVERTIARSGIALVEEYIKGREATCGVLENFRGERLYALPPIEIVPPRARSFFNYDAKYDGSSQEICPSHFSNEQKKEIMRMAKAAHDTLGLRHISRSDFIVSPRGIYILEVNTLPGMTGESLFPKAAHAVGLSYPALLEHLIGLALKR